MQITKRRKVKRLKNRLKTRSNKLKHEYKLLVKYNKETLRQQLQLQLEKFLISLENFEQPARYNSETRGLLHLEMELYLSNMMKKVGQLLDLESNDMKIFNALKELKKKRNGLIKTNKG